MRSSNHVFLTMLCLFVWSQAFSEEYGMAAIYSPRFEGSRTANGEIFKHGQYTASHKTFPFGSRVKVTRLDNGKWVIVRINDRGPYVSNRVTDLSKVAAEKLGIASLSTEFEVKVEAVEDPGNRSEERRVGKEC